MATTLNPLITKLGSDDPDVRKAATEQLTEQLTEHPTIGPYLKQVGNDTDDPEVHARLASILTTVLIGNVTQDDAPNQLDEVLEPLPNDQHYQLTIVSTGLPQCDATFPVSDPLDPGTTVTLGAGSSDAPGITIKPLMPGTAQVNVEIDVVDNQGTVQRSLVRKLDVVIEEVKAD